MALKQVLTTLEAISSEGFKAVPEVVRAVGDVTHRLRWFIVGVVGLIVVQGMIPYLVALMFGKSLLSLLLLFFR